jgi:hypothetical protein
MAMTDVLLYLLGAACLAAAVVASALFVRGQLSGASLLAALFARNPGRRLEVVEQANVDGRRRLVLIRRDDVEHLVMTGGPADVVIETGIAARRGGELKEAPAVLKRPHPLGQAAGDR